MGRASRARRDDPLAVRDHRVSALAVPPNAILTEI
jgi:hypothetical protein